jgi:hypothetical protein
MSLTSARCTNVSAKEALGKFIDCHLQLASPRVLKRAAAAIMLMAAAGVTIVAAVANTTAVVASTTPTKAVTMAITMVTNATAITETIAPTAIAARMASHTFLTAMVEAADGCIATPQTMAVPTGGTERAGLA